jgi:hypothetical protein
MEQNQLLVVVAEANPAKGKSRLLDDYHPYPILPAIHPGVILGSVLFHSIDKVEKAVEKHYKWAKWAKHEPSERAATSVLVRWDARCVDQGLRPEPSKVGQS